MRSGPVLGLKENWEQFSLLVLINGFVGAMVGLERAILPAMAQETFGLATKSALLSFILVFGGVKAAANYFAGRLADRHGRRKILLAGWLAAVPVPLMLMWGPSWNWILAANVLLGVSQGLAWSTTVIMKIDLVGKERRGLAMGLNEFAGYAAVGVSALATGWVAARWGLRPQPFYLGGVYVAAGLLLTALFAKETKGHAQLEARSHAQATGAQDEPPPSQREIARRASYSDPTLSSASWTGLVNNLNDGMAWGLFPLLFAARGLGLQEVGLLAAIYPGVWGVSQIATGGLSDRLGRKPFIVGGMLLQAAAIGGVALGQTFWHWALAQTLLGLGTAMVYPTLLSVVGDTAHPAWRASAVGVYRFWRDFGYVLGALLAGITADLAGLEAAVWLVAALTAGAGLLAGARMKETVWRRAAWQGKAVQGREYGQPEPGCISLLDFIDLGKKGANPQLVDVRSAEEYAQGHISGARNVPLAQLESQADQLAKRVAVITVCGKGGGRSAEAARLLQKLGFSARSLCGGTQGWLQSQGGAR